MSTDWLLYGATGLTGRLVAAEAVRRGARPTLAGRDRVTVRALAIRSGLPWLAFGLDDPAHLHRELRRFRALLNVAGPYSATAMPLSVACLDAGTHYVDVAGDVDVLEQLQTMGPTAERAGLTILPAAGFISAPSDCLACHLAAQVGGAEWLRVAIWKTVGGVSRGTLRSLLANLSTPARTLARGTLRARPPGTVTIDFAGRRQRCVAATVADLVMGQRSTGAHRIETYFRAGAPTRVATRAFAYARPVGKAIGLLAGPLGKLAPARQSGRQASNTAVGGLFSCKVVGPGGEAQSVLATPEAYRFTAMVAVACARAAAEGHLPTGFQSVASALGPDVILRMPGVRVIG